MPQHLGKKTFWLFVLNNSRIAFIFLIITIISLIVPSFIQFPISSYMNIAAIGAIILFLISLLIGYIAARLKYVNFTFILDNDAFKIKHGILSVEETAIPYRQIQSVDIKQTLFNRLIGVSQLVILTAGRGDDPLKGESEAEFPLIDNDLTRSLQEQLLKKSEIEEVTVEPEKNN